MKETVNKFVDMCETRLPYQGNIVEINDEQISPWARHTSQILTAAMDRRDNEVALRYARANYETYEPTVEALSSKPPGLSADEVAEKTNRSRNTESAYLWKLYLSGLVKRKKRKNKIIYILQNKDAVLQAFGVPK